MSEQLTKEEGELLKSFEKGEWKSSPKFDERKMTLKRHAQDTIRKDKRVNIRISQRDLNEIKRLAFRQGLPYQTLISSILHKYVNGIPIISR